MDRRVFTKSLVTLGAFGCSPGARIHTYDSGTTTDTEPPDVGPTCPVSEVTLPTGKEVMPPRSFEAYIGGGGGFRKANLCEYYDPDGSRGINLLVVVIAGAWCGPCVEYAQWMAVNGDRLLKRGARFLELIAEGFRREAPNQEVVDKWMDLYQSPVDTGITTFADWFPPMTQAVPTSFLIDPRTMVLYKKVGGFDGLAAELPGQIGTIESYLTAHGY